MNRGNNQQVEMINSTYKSNDDLYSRVDNLKSDSNLNTLLIQGNAQNNDQRLTF